MRDEGDRFVAWRLDDAPATLGADLEDERVEHALLAYAQRSAARVGAEWFAAEFARREQEERSQRERATGRRETLDEPIQASSPEVTLVDASVEDDVIGGAPVGLGIDPPPQPIEPTPQPIEPPPQPIEPTPQPIEPTPQPIEPPPQPAMRHPHVPRPPAPEPVPEARRRRRDRKLEKASTPSPTISAPEWARMSPGARRLYGLDASPHAATS